MEELDEALKGKDDWISLKNSYSLEIDLYEKKYKEWVERANKIIKRYRDERVEAGKGSKQDEARFNILWSNIQTMLPNVFARLPKPEVSRRYKDQDPVGRVASQILERALEFEIESYPDYGSAVRNSVEDRLLAGRGVSWVRYEPVMKTVEMPSEEQNFENEGGQVSEDVKQPTEVIDYECAPVDYVAWEDFGHNVARTWEEVHTIWRIVPLNREELCERFGSVGKKIPLDTKVGDRKEKDATPEEISKMKANIYEIWDKKKKRTVWLSKRFKKALDVRDDPLGLDRFFPCPKPLYATTTTDTLVPVPDYAIYQDLAKELDTLTDRINGLAESIKVVGVYDSTQTGIKRMLKEGVNTELIPVDNWAMFGEKGGIKGVIDWLPLDQVVHALDAAYKARYEAKQAVFEIMGIADVLRGSSDPNETLGAQQMKGQFASKRLKFMQNAVSSFATELLKIKAQIICNHYQPETILSISGAEQMPEEDQQFILPAIELLKNDVISDFRIEVSSDSLIEIDEEQEKQDRMEFLTAVSGFMEKALMLPPQLHSVAGEFLLFMVRGFKTGQQLEAQIEEAVQSLKQAANQPPPPDPEVVKAQGQQQLEQQKIQSQQQLEQFKLQAQNQSDQAKFQSQSQLDLQKLESEKELAQLKEQNELVKANAKLEKELQIEREKMEIHRQTELEKAAIAADTKVRVEQVKMGIEDPELQRKSLELSTGGKIEQLMGTVSDLMAQIQEMSENSNSPTEIERGSDGKVVSIRKGKKKLKVAYKNGRISGVS